MGILHLKIYFLFDFRYDKNWSWFSMNEISLHILLFFCIFLEFAASSVWGIYYLCSKLHFLWYHSPIKVEYLGTFSNWFHLWTWIFHDNCFNFQTKNHAINIFESSTYHVICKSTIKFSFNWLYLIFFQFSEINVRKSYQQRTFYKYIYYFCLIIFQNTLIPLSD